MRVGPVKSLLGVCNGAAATRYSALVSLGLAWSVAWSGSAHAQNAGWMYSVVHNGTYLSDLTIPGTHDSGAMVDGEAPEGTAKAQDLSIAQQLDAGVRFFDLRLNFSPLHAAGLDNELYLYHGVIAQGTTARAVFDVFSNFLNTNRGEMLFVSIKNEKQVDDSDVADKDFQGAVEALLAKYSSRILSTSTVPTYNSDLSDTHRIIVVRRYPLVYQNDLAAATIDATRGWPGGTEGNAIADLPGGNLRVQDRYDFACSGVVNCTLENQQEQSFLAEKWGAFLSQFHDAHDLEGDFDGSHRLRVNFASATVHSAVNPIPTKGAIPWFAKYMNAAIRDRLTIERTRAGAVLLDRADPTLIGQLVNMNRLRPFEAGPVSTSGGIARINPTANFFCSGAARSVCFTLPNGKQVSLGGTAVGRAAVALGQNNNETSVFVVGTDHSLYTRWQTAAASNPEAFNSSWVNLGGNLTSAPAAIRNCSGVMEVFARGSDNAVYTIWQTSPGGNWTSAWTSIGGGANSRPTVTANGCDVTVSVVGTDGRTWTKTRTNWVWGGWNPA